MFQIVVQRKKIISRGRLFLVRRLFLVSLGRFQKGCLHLVGQALRLHHLHISAISHNLSHKVARGAQTVLEICPSLTLATLFLAVVERKVLQVVALVVICPQHYSLRLLLGAHQNAIAVPEKTLGIERRVNNKGLLGDLQSHNPVKRKQRHIVPLGFPVVSLPMDLAQHIPAMLEKLDTVGFDQEIEFLEPTFEAVIGKLIIQ